VASGGEDMRGTKAKRLRRAAGAYVTRCRIRETTDRALGGGVSHYHSGVRRVYQDSNRQAKARA
jgi:hypothetical protein